MNIFSSGWLERMVNKAGATPESRIPALFEVLQDWLDIPAVRAELEQLVLEDANLHELRACVHRLVTATGVEQPDAVAGQLLIVLLGALQEAMRNPSTEALRHGAEAAALLVYRQRPRKAGGVRPAAIAATLVLMLGGLAISQYLPQNQPEHAGSTGMLHVTTRSSAVANPERVAALYHLHDQMRSASCSYPQALMLAPEQRAPFLEKVVNGDLGRMQPDALVMVSHLYQKVDCYYPPAAMLL